ncbi:MAG TPA: 50S ribosomal protein L30 [Gammaproteobacteria bacterium]|nr:50S ribosomal protein L30 [Gammaproteobacteria bacterium]
MAKQQKQLKVTLLKSRFHRKPGHAECLAGLGLRKPHQSVIVPDTPEHRGMIRRVGYLLDVEEA